MKLILTNYSVQYNTQSQPLIKSLSFSCNESGLYFVHGPNGSGKSTLFKTLSGDVLPATVHGMLTHNDKQFTLSSEKYRTYAHKTVAVVPQKYDELLAPQYTVKENLSLALVPHYPSAFIQPPISVIPHLLQEIKIPLDTPVEMLSGGQRQITAIMMALQKSKKILLLDEPTATLDPANTALVMEFLVRLYKEAGILIIMICHDHELKKYSKHKPITIGEVTP